MGLSVLGAEAAKAGINFVTGMAADSVGGLFNINQARKNRAFQERMYNKQVQDTLDFWNLQNQYNLPSAQLARIQDAGLSPLLLYGEGGLSGNLAGQSQLPSAPHGAQAQATFHNRADIGNVALLDAQKRNIDTDTLLKQREADYYKSQAHKSDVESENLSFDLAFKKDARELNMMALEKQNDLTDSMRFLNDQQRYKIVHEINLIDKELQQITANIRNQKAITDAQIAEINNRIENENKKIGHIIANLDAQSRMYLAEAYAAQVSAYVQQKLFSDDYIKILQGQAGQDFLNDIKTGSAIDIANGLAALDFMSRPEPGSNLFEYNKTMNYLINPLFSMVKDGAIAGASVYFAGKGFGGKKMPKIGY